jgi:hypothetical protein
MIETIIPVRLTLQVTALQRVANLLGRTLNAPVQAGNTLRAVQIQVVESDRDGWRVISDGRNGKFREKQRRNAGKHERGNRMNNGSM